MTYTRGLVAAPVADTPRLPDAVRMHLGQLLAATFAETSPEEDLPAGLRALLAQLDGVLAQASGREDNAFRTGLLEAAPALRRYAMTLTREHAAADDLVQDTLLRAWRARDRFEPGTKLDAWIFTIMRNHFYTGARKQGREVSDADGIFTALLTTAPEQTGRVDLQDLQTALTQLPEVMRETLVLVAVEGLSCEQVGELMCCQVGTVKSRVFRARQKLAALLGYGAGDVGCDNIILSALSSSPD